MSLASLGARARLAALAATALAALSAVPAHAATSAGCADGAFNVILPSGRVLSGDQGFKVAPSDLPAGSKVAVRGRYVSFDLNPSNFAVLDYRLSGTPVFADKTPQLGANTLDKGDLEVSLSPGGAVLRRRGASAGMMLQLKDCGTGGIFQVEPDQAT